MKELEIYLEDVKNIRNSTNALFSMLNRLENDIGYIKKKVEETKEDIDGTLEFWNERLKGNTNEPK